MSVKHSVSGQQGEAIAPISSPTDTIMAVATHAVTPVVLSAPQAEAAADLQAPIETVNALIEKNVTKYSQSPYVGYPQTLRGKADYTYHTFQQVNGYVNEAAWRYAEAGLTVEVGTTPWKPRNLALTLL